MTTPSLARSRSTNCAPICRGLPASLVAGRLLHRGGRADERDGAARTTTPTTCRPGGTISGPSMFALCDLALYVAILHEIGRVKLAVTTNVSINFLRRPEPADLIGRARLMKLGKRLAVGEVALYSPGQEATWSRTRPAPIRSRRGGTMRVHNPQRRCRSANAAIQPSQYARNGAGRPSDARVRGHDTQRCGIIVPRVGEPVFQANSGDLAVDNSRAARAEARAS